MSDRLLGQQRSSYFEVEPRAAEEDASLERISKVELIRRRATIAAARETTPNVGLQTQSYVRLLLFLTQILQSIEPWVCLPEGAFLCLDRRLGLPHCGRHATQ